MATAHWRTGYTVEELFTESDANWSFHQLVRLLVGTNVRDGELLEQVTRSVAFAGSLKHNLPPGEVRNVKLAANDTDFGLHAPKHEVECAHYNVTGLDGPLAEPFLDMLRENAVFGDGAMAAFINIFNNRVHALRYLIHAQTNQTLTSDEAANNFVGEFLLALSGHYYPAQRAFHGQSDDTLLSLSGHLANCRISLPVVKKLFLTVLNLPVIAMNSVIGRWLKVQQQDHSRMGNANHRLGDQATLGKRVWDQQAAIELVLGPMDLDRRSNLLPGGNEHQQLRDLASWLTEKRCDCRITLQCVPDAEAGKNATTLSRHQNHTNRLGYGSALMTESPEITEVSFMLELVR